MPVIKQAGLCLRVKHIDGCGLAGRPSGAMKMTPLTRGRLYLSASRGAQAGGVKPPAPVGNTLRADAPGRHQLSQHPFYGNRGTRAPAHSGDSSRHSNSLPQCLQRYSYNGMRASSSSTQSRWIYLWCACRPKHGHSSFFGLRGPIPVRIPTATFQFKGTARHDLLGPLMTARTLNGFGPHFNQALGHRPFGAFKFINWHNDSFPGQHSALFYNRQKYPSWQSLSIG